MAMYTLVFSLKNEQIRSGSPKEAATQVKSLGATVVASTMAKRIKKNPRDRQPAIITPYTSYQRKRAKKNNDLLMQTIRSIVFFFF